MPLSPIILQRIRENDPELTRLSLAEISAENLYFDTSDAYELAQALKTNTHLQVLDLQGHDIQISGILEILQSLAGNSSLKALNLRGNHSGAFPVKELLQQLKQTGLVWFDCGVSAATTNPSITPSLENLSAGRYLNMSKAEAEGDEFLALTDLIEELEDYPITHIDISGHRLDYDEYPQLAQLLAHASLTSISLNRMNLGADGAEYLIKGLQENKKITHLELDHNQLDNNFIKELAQWKGVSSLKALNLANNPEITEIALLMQKLSQAAIEELSLANNDELDRNSISAVVLFLQKNQTCQNLNLAGVNLYDFMRPIFVELPKTTLVSLNLDSCKQDDITKEEVDNLMVIIVQTLGNENPLKKLNLADNFQDDAASKFYKKLPMILRNNIGLEELTLGQIEISPEIEESLEDALKQNTHLQALDVNDFIKDKERLKKITSFLERNQELKNPFIKIDQLIQLAETLRHQEKPRTLEIRKQILECYAEAEKLLNTWEKEHERDETRYRALKFSAATSFLELGLPVKAWRRLFKLGNLDAESWQKTAEAFFKKINSIPAGIENDDYHLFILMLLRKTENTELNRSLLSKVFSSLCKTEQVGMGNETILSLEELQQVVRAARKQLESKLIDNPESEEREKWHVNIIYFNKLLRKSFTTAIIEKLCKNVYVQEQIKNVLDKNSQSIVILEQLITNKYIEDDTDILSLIPALEKKIFRKIARLEDTSSDLLEEPEPQKINSRQKINPPQQQNPPLDKNENIKNFLLALKKEILNKDWQVRVGEVGVYRDDNGALVPLGRRIPKGVQRILSAIDEKDADWSETLHRVREIATHHGHYVDVKMFFIGQSIDTQQWYQQLEQETAHFIHHSSRLKH